MDELFWLSAVLIVFVYAGYPLCLWIGARISPRPVQKALDPAAENWPKVSILIAAYNEASVIEDTVRNKLDLDYPPEKFEILVMSDASSDATDQIVENIAQGACVPVRLFRQPRSGKSTGLNTLVDQASGDILVFSDANSHYAPDALKALVSNFADPQVGYVTGKMLYTHPDGSLVGDGCSAYMRYENRLRLLETQTGSIVGVDGGIDAMRRMLFRPIRPDQLPDFVQPLKVVEQGYRVVYEPEARLHEPALESHRDEFRMRVRVSLRAMWALRDMAHLLNPAVSGAFSLKLLCHKVLRYLAFMPLTGLWFSSLLLASEGGFYFGAWMTQNLAYILALAGMQGYGRQVALIRLATYFTLVNVACAVAFWRFIQGKKLIIWQPRSG